MNGAPPFIGLATLDVMVGLDALLSATGYGRSAAYAAMAAQLLPRPVKVGRNSRWPASEVHALAGAIQRGDDEGSRRALVRQLRQRRGAPLLRAVGAATP